VAALYVVSTPIGNLGDVTARAGEVLGRVDVVLAEDTRRTGVLLRHLGVRPRLISAHEHNEAARSALVVEILSEGRDVALVSDAGTPLLSDPGARIVEAALAAGFDVVPIPGASALLAALVVSGISADRFTFYGFLPRGGGRRSALLEEIARLRHTAVVYESPHRTTALLRDLARRAGADRRAAVARELTKLHEEVIRGSLAAILERLEGVRLRGEIVVVVEGRGTDEVERERAEAAEDATALAAELLASGMSPSAIARELRERLDVPRNEAYRIAQDAVTR
jgi:16S rRNA (cytidine1402-2'-O)-methyltransferase